MPDWARPIPHSLPMLGLLFWPRYFGLESPRGSEPWVWGCSLPSHVSQNSRLLVTYQSAWDSLSFAILPFNHQASPTCGSGLPGTLLVSRPRQWLRHLWYGRAISF